MGASILRRTLRRLDRIPTMNRPEKGTDSERIIANWNVAAIEDPGGVTPQRIKLTVLRIRESGGGRFLRRPRADAPHPAAPKRSSLSSIWRTPRRRSADPYRIRSDRLRCA